MIRMVLPAALAGLCLALIACGPDPERPANAPDEGVVYHMGNTAEPASLDPHRVQGVEEMAVVNDLFAGLMTDAADASPLPGAAESYTISPDGLTYTFTMRDGHVWSDGTPVTAEDFVFAHRRFLDPATAAQYAALFYPIKNARAVNGGTLPPEALGVAAPDARTYVMTLEHPAPYLPELLTLPPSFPVPRHVIAAHGADWIKAENMVSNGAYTLSDWRPNEVIRLEKNPTYFDAPTVAIDTVFVYPTEDRGAAIRRFRAGELDSNSDVPAAQVPLLRETMPQVLRISPRLQTLYVTFNTRIAPFDDPRVRTALAMALDRRTIAEDIFNGLFVPAYAFVPPGIANYPGTARFGWADDAIADRRAKARSLLEEAGFSDETPLRFTFRVYSGTDNRRRAVAMAAMWADIGVEARILQAENKSHLAAVRAGNFEVADANWVADFNDPVNYLFLLDSETGQLNYSGYANPAYDALLARAERTLDLTARGALLSEAETMMLADTPIAPVLYGTNRAVVGPHVRGYVDNAVNEHPTRFLRIDEAARPR